MELHVPIIATQVLPQSVRDVYACGEDIWCLCDVGGVYGILHCQF